MYEAKQQIVRKEVLVDHPAKTYPNEKYTLTLTDSDPFRSPYRYNIVFETEANVQFEYTITSDNEVGQNSYVVTNEEKEKILHKK